MSHSDNIEEPSLAEADLLTVQKHIRYCLFHLQVLPTAYEGEDCSRQVHQDPVHALGFPLI